MKKTTTKYNGAYPLAAELVAAAKIERQARIFTDAVQRACLACYRTIARSGAVTNPNNDASDGKNVGIDVVAGATLSKADVKRVRKYLKQRFGARWSNLSREQQTTTIKTVINQAVTVSPVSAGIKRTVKKLTQQYGEFGALPAHIIAGTEQAVASNLAKSIAMSQGSSAAAPLAQIAKNAATIKSQIEADNFGLTREYWQSHYQEFTVNKKPLVDLVTGTPVTADAAGAVAPDVIKLAQPVIELSTIPHAPVMASLTKDAMTNAQQNFRLIVKGGSGKRLAPGVTLDEDEIEDLLGVDAYANDAQLAAETDAWAEQFIGRVQNMSEDALKRGIKVTQQAIREGRTDDWLADQLQKQMDMSAGKAKTIARTSTGNAAWNAEYYGARSAGMRLYRWRGMLDERERHEHVKREGEAFDPKHPPTDGNPGQPFNCRCTPEWIFAQQEEEEAENEIAARNAT
jgi:SPP1 gp7 family putative phage head morphogenesis protein